MYLIYLIFQLLTSLILLVFVLMLLRYTVHTNSEYHVGYLPTNLHTVGPVLIGIIKKYIKDDIKNYNLVEPGAGMGNVAYFLAQKFTFKKVIAVEDERGLLMVARFRQRFFFKTKIDFIKSNVLDYQIPEKSIVYCYLLSDIVTKMYEKCLFKDKLVITLTFPIKGVEPTENIDVGGFAKKVLVYDFRKK